MKPVRVYTKSYCGYCTRAKALLQKKEIPFEEIDVTNDDAMREKLLEMSGGYRTFPQIFIGDQMVGGYTDLAALDAHGKLEQMVK